MANALIHSILIFGHICSLTSTAINNDWPSNPSLTYASASPISSIVTNPSSPQSTGQSIKPEFTRSPPPTLSVTEGSDAIIPCEASGLPKPEVFWYKTHFESREQPALLSNNGKYSVLTDGSLKIIQVNASVDSAIYTCTQSNPFGFLKGSTSLNVEIQTHIVKPPSDVKVILSSTAEFTCSVRKDPTVQVNVSWSFNGRILENSSRIHILSDGTLRILHARNTDVGWYNCSVKSVTGNDTRRARLSLIELPHAPGGVTAVLNNEFNFVNISWNAPFDGNSPILKYIIHSKILTDNNNENLDETGSFRDLGWVTIMDNVTSSQTFVLLPTANLRPAKSYQFRVRAVNSIGEGQNSIATTPAVILPAKSPSAPPVNVVGAARSSTAIMIQWHPPGIEAHNGQLSGYVVRYKLAGYSDTPWYYINVTHAAQLSYLLDDLIVWHIYDIQVAASNEMGVGVFSQSIYIRTKEGQPASPPNQIEVRALNSTSVQVWWQPPDPQLINGINQGYKLRAYSKNMALAKELIVPPNPLPHETQTVYMYDLEPFTTYMVTVACFTSAGDGPTNDPPVEVKTKQDFPEEVADFKFWDLFDTNVKLVWSIPEKINGELVGYDLKYCIIGSTEDQCNVLHYSPETTESAIHGLKPETTYLFAINARTQIGAGPTKELTIKTKIPPVLPLPPTKLAISNIGAFSVVLQFTPGFNGNASIDKWIVESQFYRIANASWSIIFESSNHTHTNAITVKNLTPYTEYRLRLIPFNIVGRSINTSEPSPPFQTLQSPPAQSPSNVTARPLTPTSLRVKWTPLPLESWYGHPRGYNVTWKIIDEEYNNGTLMSHFSGDYRAHSFLINGLEEFSNYEVQVIALNDVGYSVSDMIIARTTNSTPQVMDVDYDNNEVNAGVIQANPSDLQLRTRVPFHREIWFVVSCASFSIIFIVMFIAILCVQSKAYKYKQEAKKGNGSQDGFSEAGCGLDDVQDSLYPSGFELRQNGEASNYRRSNGTVSTTASMAATKSPPRPSPGSITYSDEEEDIDDEGKDGNLYGSSGESLTEKPSELSSSGPDSESERDDDMSAANHFVNHYANVNDTLRKGQPSWKKYAHHYVVKPPPDPQMPSRPAPPVPGHPAPPSYHSAVAVTASEDSELESPSVNLNGGRIIVNNMAGSRAPLPGFSSFV